MIARTALSILIWVLGAAFGFLLDGQVFRGTAILGGCVVACIVLWLPLLRSSGPPRRRRGAIVAVLLNAALAAVAAASLPEALERQRAFNRHLSLAQPLSEGDVSSRKSWALAYLQLHPGAEPLKLIGDYNATPLGKRLGYFSLADARAIATELASSTPDMSNDGLVTFDFVDLFPHKFWISDWSSDSQYPDGFRYKLLSTRRESVDVIQFLVVLQHRSGDKEVLSTIDVTASVFDRVAATFVDGLATQHGLDFEEQDFSSCRTLEAFDEEAAIVGWSVTEFPDAG
jgi:hypothetical protein